MSQKKISQLVTPDGKPAAPATSAPGVFIHDQEALRWFPQRQWAPPFSDPSSGNQVDFYVTGESYFDAVASAIEGATESIYIAGWQVNFDVELKGGKTLFEYLEAAIDRQPALRIYVMPWLSPKVGVDTGDFETMLAVFQLNAGLPPPARAFAMPAIAQSDMPAGLGIGFSHHQKLVVIDQKRAFVGGIDLAYGRRDNGRFSLRHDGRTGNELYNSCIPPVHEVSHVEQTAYLTRAELMAACFDGFFGKSSQFLTSAQMRPIAWALDKKQSATNYGKDKLKEVSDWWSNTNLLGDFVRRVTDKPIDKLQDKSRWAYRRINQEARGQLDRLRSTGSANAASAASAAIAWLNNADMTQLPEHLRKETVETIEAFVITALTHLSGAADQKAERYENLKKLRKMVPPSGMVISTAQPRMPWHDVHASIEGPAASDLCRNFVLRWNGIAHRYEMSKGQAMASRAVTQVFQALGIRGGRQLKVPRLPQPPAPSAQPKNGSCWVQVLRSAPLRMQRDEARANPASPAPQMAQDNCLKGMLTAIQGAQKFIYIEGQFFQSAYGVDTGADQALSGPMAALIDITKSPQYEKYARQLGIYGVKPIDIPKSIRWSQVDDVLADTNGKGADFMNDLSSVLKNLASIKASNVMGPQQQALLNPIGEAIAKRIEKAIWDKTDFHVYMVIPVHPEGTLDTLNIMTQLHLTMQSLVFGKKSLVNRIRRALMAANVREKNRNLTPAAAMEIVDKYDDDELQAEIGSDWEKYLTLLNLRNWDTLQKRPVTEQIYVHSKLLIADDRVAILGSANINDRSQLGDRDSELAVIVRDDAQIKVKLDGVHMDAVSAKVHDLRMRLWKKLLGLSDGAKYPASGMTGMIEEPIAVKTISAIRQIAKANAEAYSKAFPFLANIKGDPSSIWPTWDNIARKLVGHMPFAPRFWRDDEIRDELHTWDAAKRLPEAAPIGIQGFIVSLPATWTKGENNISGMNLTMLAQIDEGKSGVAVASTENGHKEKAYG